MEIYHEMRKYRDNYKVWQASYPDMSFLAHWHNEIEMIYVRSGTAFLVVDGIPYHLQQGDLFICGSRSLHYSDSYRMPNRMDFILMDASVALGEAVPPHDNRYFAAHELATAGLDCLLAEIYDTVQRELDAREEYYKNIVCAALRLLWFLTARIKPPQNAEKAISTSKIGKVIEYLYTHYREPISLNTAAMVAGLTPVYFSELFRRLTGQNFISYLQCIRIEQVARCLLTKDDKIINIAYDCGFTNVRSFNRIFRKHMGITPSQFQKQCGKDPYFGVFFDKPDSGETVVENDSFVVKDNRSHIFE